ncbi:MAG: DUF5906 domain-containing protein [Treponema sp.]|jgi:putative DNA primase/helicase|nr:DUF5906 domain-containing protein [Treponema sp.]
MKARRKAASTEHYINTGLRVKKSEKREQTEAGRLAAFIIDMIPKEYDVWEECDINEVHLSCEIIKTCGRWIRYCPQIGWMVYKEDEGRWTNYGAESAVQRVITHFGELLNEGAASTNPGEKRFARRILSSAGIGAIKRILEGDVSIAVDQKMFDADPYHLNCRGDMYDLRTGEKRASAPEDLFSKSTICKAAELEKIKEGWKMPRVSKIFEDFLVKITSKEGKARSDLAFYLLSWFGYCLTGDTGASFFVNFHGIGKNGKSVLLNLMLQLFGDYAMTLHSDIVIERYAQSQFDESELVGKRLAVLIDAPEGRLNMDKLKSIVSGDQITAKRKYLANMQFSPICKIAVGSNPRLTLKDTGLAVRRRIRMVPFDYVVSDDEDDPNIGKRMLKEEGSEILALLIWFAHQYYKEGEGPKAFPGCKVVDEASAEYMESEDLVGRWKKERTETAEPEKYESAGDLYEDFRKWCDDEGVRKKMSKNKFGEYLTTHVPNKKRTEDGIIYQGIRLKPRPILQQSGPPTKDKGGG